MQVFSILYHKAQNNSGLNESLPQQLQNTNHAVNVVFVLIWHFKQIFIMKWLQLDAERYWGKMFIIVVRFALCTKKNPT